MAFTNLALTMYPVGSLYFSSIATSPAGLFGGTWTQLDDNKFLRPSNSFGETGGSDTHTHTHTLLAAFDSAQSYLDWKYSSCDTYYPNWRIQVSTKGWDIKEAPHTSGVDILGNINGSDNVPAYRTVYCWYRVS